MAPPRPDRPGPTPRDQVWGAAHAGHRAGRYPIAYLVPAVQLALGDITAEGAVLRTILFTLADITSKIIFGILLEKVLQVRSAEESYGEAADAWPQATEPLPGHRVQNGALVRADGAPVGRQPDSTSSASTIV